MKKSSYILASLIIMSGLLCGANAQSKSIPSPDLEVVHDKEPSVLHQVQPAYPASMMEGGWEANVYVKAYITTEGYVAEAQCNSFDLNSVHKDKEQTPLEELKTDGKAFQESALKAVKQWKFSPAQMQGKPVAVWVTIPFRFKLAGEKKTPVKESDNSEMEKSREAIGALIENILKGKETEKAKRFISINASLIYDTEIVNLYSVVNGENKKIHLTEDKDSKCIHMNIKINDEYSSAIVLWKSKFSRGKKERIHSIVLTKTPPNDWQIVHWHVSW